MPQVDTYIRGLPLAELHLHIEGTLSPELMFKFAQRNGIALASPEFPYSSVEEITKAYRFGCLQDFLNIYYTGMNVLKTRQDFYDLAMAYFERAAAGNVIHADVMFDPQAHVGRGVPYGDLVNAFADAAGDADAKFGLTVRYIHSILRHLSEEEGLASLKMAEPYLGDGRVRIAAVGLDSSERGNPPMKFARLFARAKEMGLLISIHAGEEGGADYVRQALDLGAARIEHGNHALDDKEVIGRIVREQVPMDLCPLSNLSLGVVKDLKQYPIPQLLAEGTIATVNSDDPAYFGGYVKDNYLALAGFGLIGIEECKQLAVNSARSAFVTEQRRSELIECISGYHESFFATPQRPAQPQ